MGLASAMNTALTGLNAAETTIDVIGNNLANANTVGFKASNVNFATQFLQTQSLGSSPTTTSGGTNPTQTGLGTMVADITPDFNQGTIEISSNSTDLAIQGDGFFLVEGTAGAQLYTRDGVFEINSENNLTTSSGYRLLGYGIDSDYEIQTTTLQSITIPLGTAAVAQPTSNVYIEGTLSPTGDVASTAEIILTDALGDGSYTAPGDTAAAALSSPPNTTGPPPTEAAPTTGGLLTAGVTYQYRVVFGDGTVGSFTDTESVPSIAVDPVTLGAGQNAIALTDIPVDDSGTYSTRRLYRSDDGGTTYNMVAEIADNVTTSYTDTLSDVDAAAAQTLDDSTLTGNYSYYITFADAAGGPGVGTESRPSELIGPINVADGRIQLDNLPIDDTGDWSVIRIYRNLSTDDSEFHFLDEINNASIAGMSYTDSASDADIVNNTTIDLDGPRIDSSTLLTDVLQYDDGEYTHVFQEGTLSLTVRKGDSSMETQELEIASSTTVLDYLNFLEQASGIRTDGGNDPTHPIPDDESGAEAGGSVTANGEIRLVSNNGVGNAVEIGLSAMTLTTASGTENVELPFNSIQEAVGESVSTDFVAYDSLGIDVSVHLTCVLESRTSSSTTYRWYADSADSASSNGVDISVGTGLVTFDGEGNYIDATETTVSIDRRDVSSASPLEFELDFSELSGLAVDASSLAVSNQDGSAPGVLNSFIIDEDGTVRGVFSNGVTRDLGQIVLARFSNPAGLEQKGENLYATGVNSGLPVVGTPGEQGIGSVISGAVELSNADIGTNLIDLILASTMYRGNTRVITTAQEMYDELLALR